MDSVGADKLNALSVHAVNDANSFFGFRIQRLSESDKLTTWGVQARLKLKGIDGAHYSGDYVV